MEDNRTNAIILNTFMSNKGFECQCAENGELGLKAITQGEFDLVLMDNHMPVMDGVEATAAMRTLAADKANILILGCTADVFKDTRERMLGAGVDSIISKPIDEAELDDTLVRHLTKLYQFKPQLLNSNNEPPMQFEERLMMFLVAIENQQLDNGQSLFAELKQSLNETQTSALNEILCKIEARLLAAEFPLQQDLDLLTVQVKDYC